MTIKEAQVSDLIAQLTLEEKIALTVGRDFWSTNDVERLGIPAIALNDGPHGVRKPPQSNDIGIGNSIPATCFPTAVALASSWDTALAEEIGRALGEEAQALDTQVLLGPGVNIKRTPLGGRNFEYFSEDPVLAGELGAAWVRGVQSQGVGTSLKHYACNNQEFERMTINVEVDQRTFRELYLAAFERVVKNSQPWTVMASYNKVNGTYATEHSQLLSQILKEEWGFEGVAVSDWGAVNNKAATIEAGLDLEMPGPGLAGQSQKLIQLVKEGQLSEAALDRAVERVLNLILKGHASRKPGASFDKQAHHALARRAAAESIVLLKNSDNVLPLDQARLSSVAVIGQFAAQPRYQGSGSSQMIPTELDITLTELKNWLGESVKVTFAEGYGEAESADEVQLKEAADQARQANVAIVFAGLPDSFESEGFDRKHIFMPESHNRLIEEVCKAQPNTIVVLHNGSVVAMPWLDGPKAILEVGLGGQAIGGAIVDVLSGKVNPSGKLAETFPVKLEDTPAFINYPGEANTVHYGEGLFVGYRYYDKKQVKPLFPFGFGLSYTTFEYSGLTTDKTEFKGGDKLAVTVTVKNTGTLAGKEVVQLYVQSLNSQYARPVRELKAFAKVALEPGESREVQLTLNERDFMVYDAERENWRMEGGAYQIEVGGSSAELPVNTEITVKEDAQAARRTFTRMSLIKHFLADPVGKKVIEQTVEGTPAAFWLSAGEMLTSIPIIKVSSFGMLPEEVVDRIITQTNQTPLP